MGWFSNLFGGDTKERTMKMEPSMMKEGGKEVMKMAKDPVCGMEVDEKSAAAKSEHMGKTYYFCSPGCKKTFDANDKNNISDEGEHREALDLWFEDTLGRKYRISNIEKQLKKI